MSERKPTEMPLVVVDMVETPPVKPSGRRTITNLDAIADVPNESEIVVQCGCRTFKTTKGELLGSLRLTDTSWDDIKFPFIGRNLDTTSGRIDYNWTELGIDFAANARYADTEQISMIVQMNHDYKIGTNIHPHIHWIQSADVSPNWLIEYRLYDNSEAIPAVWTKATSTKVFTYTSGTILQISSFPEIDMSSVSGVSSFIDVKFYRDVGNTSGEFGGAESAPAVETVKEFDIHYQRDSFGSNTEFSKD